MNNNWSTEIPKEDGWYAIRFKDKSKNLLYDFDENHFECFNFIGNGNFVRDYDYKTKKPAFVKIEYFLEHFVCEIEFCKIEFVY